MSTITSLNSTDSGSTSRTVINTNITNLNTDKVEGQSSSVDSEVALFSGTGGKTIKRASSSGIAKLTSGVLSAVTAPSGAIVGDTDSQTLTNKTLTTPTIGSFANANHNHTNSAGGGTLSESALALTDVTTANASTSAHGFLKKLDNNASHYLDGTGNWVAITVITPRTLLSRAMATSDSYTAGSTSYISFENNEAPNATEMFGNIVPFAGTLRNLYIRSLTIVADSLVATVRVNGVDTGITVTFANVDDGVTKSDTTHTASVSAGDAITLKVVAPAGGSSTLKSYSLELDPS